MAANDTYDSSESVENDNTTTWYNDTEIANKTYNEIGNVVCTLQSPSTWLTVLIVFAVLLVLVNLCVYVKCVMTLKKSLCAVYYDMVLWAYTVICFYLARSGAVFRSNRITPENLVPPEELGQTPSCCCREKAHTQPDTVDGNHANSEPDIVIHVSAEEKAAADCEQNDTAKYKKNFEKTKLQTVPEESFPYESMEFSNFVNEAPRSTPQKPPRKQLTVANQDLNPEVYI